MQVQENAINKLEEVFAAFNRVGAELDFRYRELETQVARLSGELAAARSARLRELAEKERLAARLGALMDALPGGVLVIDAEGRVREENPAAAALLGGSCLDLRWTEVLARAGAAAPDDAAEFSLGDGRRLSCRSSEPADSGERVLLLTDVSETYRLHERRSREKRLAALGEMSARLAHQVRTPLSAALLYLSQLQPDDAAGADIHGRIRDRLRRIDALVESLLDFLRGATKTCATFSLADLLREAAEAARPQVDAAGGTLHCKLPADACSLEGDRQALYNAIANLIDNALQACGPGPRLRLELDAGAREYELRVRDNGKGIAPETAERLFEPFFSTRPHGTGLGLAVVASAARAHGGKAFASANRGGGAVFHIRLPREGGRHGADALWTQSPEPAEERA